MGNKERIIESGSYVLSMVFGSTALFAYLYVSRSTGMLPVITYPYRDFTFPLFTISLLLLITALVIRGSSLETDRLVLPERKFLLQLVVFLGTGFLMKIGGEVIHEILGHGLFILLFGGEILGVHVSLWWPYELSYISHNTSDLLFGEQVLIIAGGIAACLVISFVIQALLLAKKFRWEVTLPLFWLSFWCFINATGYFMIGGFAPFGDVKKLIELGVMTPVLSVLAGTISFLAGFTFLSKILREAIKDSLNGKTKQAIVIFWLVIPVLAGLVVASRGLPVIFTLLGFLPVVLSFILELRLTEK
ncbi:MAG: hypothetical protein ACFFD4_16465 [Candidatus Odinarchaeota archaeon]